MQHLTIEQILTPSEAPLRGAISPEVAKDVLKRNISNRTLSAKHIEVIQREMEQGVFAYTGDPIRLDVGGNLIDGQHRLIALINAGVAVEFAVVNNLPAGVMSVIDTGRKRSPGDQLRLKGILNASNVVSAINAIFALAADRQNMTVTTIEIEAFIADHPQILDSVMKVQHTQARDRCGLPAILAALHFVGTVMLRESKLADEFVHVFASGERFYTNDAAFAYREHIITQQTRWSKTVLKASTMRAMMIRAWNEFRKRKPASKRPPRLPLEVRIDGFDPALIGLGHIRHRTPRSIDAYMSAEARADRDLQVKRRGDRRAEARRTLMPLAHAPDQNQIEHSAPDLTTLHLRRPAGVKRAIPSRETEPSTAEPSTA